LSRWIGIDDDEFTTVGASKIKRSAASALVPYELDSRPELVGRDTEKIAW